MEEIRVLIVDDHPVVREGIASMLKKETDFKVVGEASNGLEAVEKARELAPPGIIGPFCLETVITDDLKIFTFEISARIVAGTNVGIGTSPYAYLRYGENMYMGRRIAVEIKEAVKQKRLNEIAV